MKTSLSNINRTVIFIVILFVGSLVHPCLALASPTARLTSGYTVLNPGSDFMQSLKDLGINFLLVSPGRQQRGQIRFTIRAGNFDTETRRGELIHEGGIRLSNGRTAIDLLNFVIDTTGSSPTLSALVRVNNSVSDRLPLFTLTFIDPIIQRHGRYLNLPNISLALRNEAAATLNQLFSTNVFHSGANVGSASINSHLNYNFNYRCLRNK